MPEFWSFSLECKAGFDSVFATALGLEGLTVCGFRCQLLLGLGSVLYEYEALKHYSRKV